MKIWCVEDDSSIRDIEVYTLHSTGFEARGFADGAAFRTALETEEPDLVVYLDMPTDRAVEMLRSRENATHTKGDIHEVDTAYLAKCRRTAHAAAALYGWRTVSCVDCAGRVRSIEEIHEEVWSIVRGTIG